MNGQISWESSLIKKYSSSNHFKLLNQLRNEVKKYPLNYKKNTTSTDKRDPSQDDKNKTNNYESHNLGLSKETNQTNEKYSNNSTVSFNNSKNFSIYNNISTESNIIKNQNTLDDQSRANNDSSSNIK